MNYHPHRLEAQKPRLGRAVTPVPACVAINQKPFQSPVLLMAVRELFGEPVRRWFSFVLSDLFQPPASPLPVIQSGILAAASIRMRVRRFGLWLRWLRWLRVQFGVRYPWWRLEAIP
jgi:hypothetical protein